MKTNKFLGLLKSKGENVDWLSDRIVEEGERISRSAIYKKLRGDSEFTAQEIKIISKIMDFTNDEMLDIFFEELVS
jgi:hypothetical protein